MGKRIFASYSWDSEEHKQWVVKLINDLRSKYGFIATCDTICDESELNTMIVDGITKSDKIIVVITRNYTYKAENKIGGVWKETKLLHNRYFDDEKSIVPILKEFASPPAYLKSIAYIDFTTGLYDDNLNALAKRLNDKTEYEASSVTKTPLHADDFDLIPDLRINDPRAELDFLKTEFIATDKRIMSLIQTTQSQYPGFKYTRTEKEDVVQSESATFINGQLVQMDKRYRVVTYKIDYNNKTGYVKFWMPLQNDNFSKGIYGLFDEHLYYNDLYNSYNFAATINRAGKRLELNAHVCLIQKAIKTGKDLGEYIFQSIVECVKQ